MKIICINTKGGVGKSTVSAQVIVPYLHTQKGNEFVNLFEFDDENQDAKSFNLSKILNAKQFKVTGSDIDATLTEIITEYEDCIIDVGGNKTTTFIMESLRQTNLIYMLDAVVIPLTDGEQDAINACQVYHFIRNLNPDIKIIFALSRVDTSIDLEMQFLDFFGDSKGRLDDKKGLIEEIDEKDRNLIYIKNDESIKVSRIFGVTVYELAQIDLQNLKQKAKKALESKEKDRFKKATYRITAVNKAIQFKENVLEKAFSTINQTLKNGE